jgi:hypothetical protein
MSKLDLTKHFKSYYTAKAKPEVVEIETAHFLSITGKGDPSDKEFLSSIQAMYATAYTIKFAYKAKSKDFVVARLEAQWWFDEHQYGNVTLEEAPTAVPRSEWQYRLLIRMPDYVTKHDVKSAAETVVAKKQIQLAGDVEFYTMAEGKTVQMLHVGPFDKEPETLKEMKTFMQAHNFKKNGLHHEIYLSDFRKTAPEKLRTILREPVK